MRYFVSAWFALASILFAGPPQAHAQSQATSESSSPFRGNVFGGGLLYRSEVFPHVGGAIELGILPRVSLGGEAGIVADRQDKTASFLISSRARYAIANALTAESAWVPFVAAGLSHAVETGFNVGGGAEYWGRGQLGLRLEALAHLIDDARFVEFRAGFAFRRSARPRP